MYTYHTNETVDLDGAVAVVLDDLIVGRASAATRDRRHTGGSAALDAQRVLAHIVPPDVVNGAVVLVAVNALHLVLSDDGVLECGAGLQLEHSRIRSALGLTLTGDIRALERLQLAIEDLPSLDDLSCRVLDGSGAGGPRAIGHRGGGGSRKEKSGGRCEWRRELDHCE
ncbi:hypothetical protein P3T76_012225 [Phytophthora citrophthora]|uniref:Uncharacterized protein n=1 Tax=Phytophthora citrophthora TaxID=4793 RepID=A0AAD9G5K0_9STRA|nr:hypothetical protein P3T76_012225 [Phytophthora citrophthora]